MFDMLAFFTNLSLMDFRSDIWPFYNFRGNKWLRVVMDERSYTNDILVMLDSLKGPFLVLHFSYYILMTFLMILSVILLSILMIILSTVTVISHLICGNHWNWLLNLNLIYETRGLGQEVAS